jgi:signal transduction histidine kinase
MREGVALGTIFAMRFEVRPFVDQQVDLLKTFADQAVIAIENVRLFNETKEALERQTATAEILQVISQSPTDVQPVFDAIVQSAVRLCDASRGTLYSFDGERMDVLAWAGYDEEQRRGFTALFPMAPSRLYPPGRAILDRDVVKVVAVLPDLEAGGFDTASIPTLQNGATMAVPLMREGAAIGALGISRLDARPYSESQIALLKTFADQAVIAIENVRLFTELEARNRDLTESLEQQTATSEILKVISRSQTDLQPVFDTIADNALSLCAGLFSIVVRYDGETIHLVALANVDREAGEAVRRQFPYRPSRASAGARAILDRQVVYVPDIREDPEYQRRNVAEAANYRSVVSVPMLRDIQPIGAITVCGAQIGAFSPKQIELLQTFADQAVIAIENVRLFKELEARTHDLARSVGELRALGEVGRAVSSTLDVETVLTTIVSRAVELSGLDDGVVFEYDEAAEEFVQRVATETGGALAEARRTTRIRKGEGVLGRTAITLEPVQVPDITVPGAYEGRLRETLVESGIRAILAVPMVREGKLIGCLAVTGNRPGEFPAETIELLRTFATQSALAIQNARLFREIEDKSRQLEVASQHKSEFLANMSHELRTPLNAIIGFSEVLSDRMFGELNEKQEEYLKDIYASGTHLLSLINDILDLSKIEAGRMELELTEFDLPTAIDNALMLVRERAGRRSVALHTNIDNRLGQIEADERKVRQVVLNLLSNAIKFTPEGGRIDVGAVAKSGSVEVSVSDTGIGIAPEDQEKVFEEFRQVGTAAKKIEGTGLGLTLCRKFVELHGGRIWVKSQLGVGSTFTFRLPLCNV